MITHRRTHDTDTARKQNAFSGI